MPITKKKKRRSAESLVFSIPYNSSWYEQLSDKDRDYVNRVIELLRAEPNIPVKPVARELIKELDIKRCIKSVEDTLRKMV